MKWAPVVWKAVTKTFQTRARRASRVSQGSEPGSPTARRRVSAPSSHNICTAFSSLPSPYPHLDSRPSPGPARRPAPPRTSWSRAYAARPRGPDTGGGGGGRRRRGRWAQPRPGPAPPRPTLRPSPPLSRALLPSASAGSALCPARPPRSPAGKAALAPAKGEAPPRLGAGVPRGLPGRPQKPLFAGRAGRESGVRRRLPTPALSRPPCSSSFPPRFLLLSRPPKVLTPRGREGAALGADKGAGRAEGGCGRHARSREGLRVPGCRPDSHWAAGAAWGRRGAGGEAGGRGACPTPPAPPPGPRGACVRKGVADRSRGLGLTPPHRGRN